jgi:aminopeptidase N
MSKICPICKENKPLSEYDHYFSKERNKLRPQNYCKVCQVLEKRKRSAAYFQKNKEQRLNYAKQYRKNPENKEKLNVLRQKFKKKYREILKDCYVKDLLKQRGKVTEVHLKELPEIIETKRLQIKIKRKLKEIRDGKK